MTNIVTGTATNSIPYYTNTVSTQQFLCAIGPDTNNIDTNFPPVFSWPLAYATNQLTTNVALVPFDYIATGTCARVSSNLWLDAAGVRDLDVYFALRERYDAAGFEDPDPPRFYRSHYDNVVAAKAQLAAIVPSFLDTSNAPSGSFNDYFTAVNTNGDFWTNGIVREFPQYHGATNLAVFMHAPTNYFDLTMVRSVDMEGGTRLYYLVTSTNYITLTGTNAAQILTQNVFKTWGEPWQMIGTNGQRFTDTSTNHDMERLFTTADYGQWRLRVAITNLQATQSGDYDGIDTTYARYSQSIDQAPFFGVTPTNWTQAKSVAEAEYATNDIWLSFGTNTGAGIVVNSWGQRFDDGGTTWANGLLNATRLLLAVTNQCTNLTFRADWYIWPMGFMRDMADTTNFTYDANGLISGQVPQILTAQTATGSNGYAEAAAWFGFDDPLSETLPAWCDEPPPDMTIYERGFYGVFRAALWWDFKYR